MQARCSRLSLVVLCLLAGLLIAGCSWLPGGGAATPQEAARDEANHQSGWNAGTFRIAASRRWRDSVIVLYTVGMAGAAESPASTLFGYYLVRPEPLGGWRAAGGGAISQAALADGRQLVGYSLGRSGPPGAYSIVYGRVLAPGVSGIAVDFDDGTTLRDTAEDGGFAVAVAEQATPCRLTVFGQGSTPLQIVDLAPGGEPGKEGPGELLTRCQRPAGQGGRQEREPAG